MLDTKMLLGALEELESRGVSREITIQALKEAFESIFKKKNYDDVRVQVDILPELGEINIYSIRKVVEEVVDDALEVELEEAQEINKDIKIGDDLYERVELDNLSKKDALSFKSILRQKIKEAEKAAILEAYSDKQGELISGTVEKIEQNLTFINIGRVTVVLNNKHKIGDETFQIGQTVKVHLSEVSSAVGGPQLHVSRADSGFLRRLFEEEIHEIYDGTVVIKDIAREAGERSKVSVISKDPNVDPIGACIGQGGTKIQKICQQIGREKIDIVQYHELPGLFIAEALKPATVLGVCVNDENKTATAVVRDGDLRVAIGKRGINVLLAVRLTGWKIDIKELTQAMTEHIDYTTLDVLAAQEEELLAAKKREELVQQAQAEALSADNDFEEVEETVAPVEEVKASEEKVEEVAPKQEVKFEEEKVVLKPVIIGEKFSIDAYEKQLVDEKKKNKNQPKVKKYRKEEVEEEETPVEKVDRNNYMEVEYTAEELEEIENQEAEDAPSYDDDIDYDEYDKYYED